MTTTQATSATPTKTAAAAPALPLTPALTKLLNSALKVPVSASNHALQVVALPARAWAADEMGQACRPWYLLVLEIYPRGKVINHSVHRPASVRPDATALLTFALKHIVDPPTDELSTRPTHLSFVDKATAAAAAPHLARLRIKCEALSIADGVSDYLRKFSDKLITTERATRSEASERSGMLAATGVTASSVQKLMASAVNMFNIGPWSRIPEHVALEIRLPCEAPARAAGRTESASVQRRRKYREKYYVTILGSERKIYGFAIVPSLAMLRDKYRKVMLKRTDSDGDKGSSSGRVDAETDGGDVSSDSDSDDNDSAGEGHSANNSVVTGLAPDIYVCSWCGRRVGRDVNEDFVQRCSACHKLLYCDEACQREDWRARHRSECREACADGDYVFNRPEWRWIDRELALLFLDPTSVPFDDLDGFEAHGWAFIDAASPPLYPLPFVSVQSGDGMAARRDLSTEREVEVFTLVSEALGECLSTPPAGSTLHMSNGVSISLAENLAESLPLQDATCPDVQ